MVFDSFYNGLKAKSNYILTAALIAGSAWVYHLGSYPEFKQNKELEEVVRVEEINGSLWNISLKDLIQYSPARRDSALNSFLELAAERDSLTSLETYPSREVLYKKAEDNDEIQRVLAISLFAGSLLGFFAKVLVYTSKDLKQKRERLNKNGLYNGFHQSQK